MAWWTQLNNLDKIKGNDYSRVYTKNKNAFLYIGKEGDEDALIVFKPFVSSISYDLKVDTTDMMDALSVANSPKVITGADISIKIELDLPATSVSEADANAAKISTFMSWLRDPSEEKTSTSNITPETCSVFKQNNPNAYKGGRLVKSVADAWRTDSNGDGPDKLALAQACAELDKNNNSDRKRSNGDKSKTGTKMVFLISFANLIQSGNYTEEHEILQSKSDKTYKNMQTYGLRCLISNVKATVDNDMGYFESNDLLLPKTYKLTLNIEIINEHLGGSIKNILGFGNQQTDAASGYDSSAYHSRDIGTWPFGIAINKDNPKITNNYSYLYANNRNSFIEFSKHNESAKFLPFVNSLSIETAIDKKNLHEFKHLTGKDRLIFATKQPNYSLGFDINAINVSHAKTIHLNLQKMMRMIYPKLQISTTTVCQMLVKFKNLIGTGAAMFETTDPVQCICTDFSIKPNLELGFFDEDGMLYYKSFTIGLSLQANDPNYGG